MIDHRINSNAALVMTGAVLTSLAVGSVSSAVGDEPCDPLEVFNPIVFPPTGADPLLSNWVHKYNASTFLLGSNGAPIGAPAAVNTEQPNQVWQKLVSFPESTPLHIQIKDPDTHEIVPYTIENPVLVISLNVNKPSIFSGSGFQSVRDDYLPILDLNSNGEVVFRPYKVNTDDKTYNNWMTAHIAEQEGDEVAYAPGTTLHYVREVLGLGGCSDPEDPSSNAIPCVLAPSIGVSGVGMPYMFSNDSSAFTNPWEYLPNADSSHQPASARWWKQQLYVFVADRDAFVRPSFNPSMRRTTVELPTQNGRPIWSPKKKGTGSYRPPNPGEPLYAAYIKATENFLGYTDNGGDNPPTEYQGTQGFEDWLEQWKINNWTPPKGDWEGLDYVVGFPFSGLGLTLNWNEFDPNAKDFVPGDLSGSFGAASEMIHATHHPMFLITYIEPHQYLNEPTNGEVPWCDTCPGDFNRDGMVDGDDLAELLLHWDFGDTPSAEGQCFNIDRQSPTIGAGDLGQLLANWGHCGWPLPEFRPADCP